MQKLKTAILKTLTNPLSPINSKESRPGLEVKNVFISRLDGSLQIEYSSGKIMDATLSVYSINGKGLLVKNLVFEAGNQASSVKLEGLKTGLYLVRIEKEGYNFSRKLLVF